MTSSTFVDRVAGYFRRYPNTWISAQDLEGVGGRQAWRTRVSDVRRCYSMNIENRVRMVREDGRVYKRSEYRYVPKSDPVQAGGLF